MVMFVPRAPSSHVHSPNIQLSSHHADSGPRSLRLGGILKVWNPASSWTNKAFSSRLLEVIDTKPEAFR